MSDATYQAAVRDHARAQGRKYYAAHREERRADARAYYRAHRTERLAYKKVWREANLGRVLERERAYEKKRQRPRRTTGEDGNG